MAYFTGKTGELEVAGSTVPVTNWSADTNVDLSETSHSGSGGHKTFVVGLDGCTGTVELNWDAAANPQAAPYLLKRGQTIANFHLYLEAGEGFLDIDEAIINGVSYAIPVDGNVAISVSFTATGNFTEPIGNW